MYNGITSQVENEAIGEKFFRFLSNPGRDGSLLFIIRGVIVTLKIVTLLSN